MPSIHSAKQTQTIVVKAADETVNNSNVLQDDDELFVSVQANARYSVEAFIVVGSLSVNSDFKFKITVPAGATLRYGHDGSLSTAGQLVGTGVSPNALLTGTDEVAAGSSAGPWGFWLRGILTVGATAGNLTFQWAQNTATVEDTIVRAGSFLIVLRLS